MYTDVNQILIFLAELKNEGLQYSALNTARSALGSFTVLSSGRAIGTEPLISRFLKGVFNSCPPKPRYKYIWDVGVVLDYIRGIPPVQELDLKQLSLKLCFLIAVTTAQRIQTLDLLQVDQLNFQDDSASFMIFKLVKQSRPGHSGMEVTLKAYPSDVRLCVLKTLQVYLQKTSVLRGREQALFISYKKPHRKVSKDTLARWIKTVLHNAGIDTSKFKAHSTRAAATSAAESRKVPVSDILATAGWTSENTFRTFYKKPILSGVSFADAILNS